MSGLRVDKINSELKKNISAIISSGRVKNPHITEMFSILEVSCDKDLTFARVIVSVYSTDEKLADSTFSAISASAGFIRQCLAKEMRLRTVPQLQFVRDKSMQYGEKIDRIINQIHQSDEVKHEGDE